MARILLVEDDQWTIDSLSKVLIEKGKHEVETAFDAKQALKKIAERANFDLLITDIYMKHSGIELISELRNQQKHIPTIAISGGSVIGGNTVLLDVVGMIGADITLTRPVKAEQLIESVSKLLNI